MRERHPVLGEALTVDVVRQVVAATLKRRTMRGRLAAAVRRITMPLKLDLPSTDRISKTLDEKARVLLGESPNIDAACDVLISALGIKLNSEDGRRVEHKNFLRDRRGRRKRVSASRRKRRRAVGTADDRA